MKEDNKVSGGVWVKASEIFDNNSDCYADTWVPDDSDLINGKYLMKEGDVVPAMTKEKFIELYNQAQSLTPLAVDNISKESAEEAAKNYAIKFKTQVSSEGLENIANDFKSGAEWQASQPVISEGWVNVEDVLPEIGEYVLVNLGGYTILMGRLMLNGWTALFRNGESLTGNERDVTHWQPLPIPPKN